MEIAPLPPQEESRLLALNQYEILDTLPEKDFDDLTALAAYICDTPIALISLVDCQRQWFKSKIGLSVDETPRDIAFCSHTILEPTRPLIVQDALEDKRFADSPLVTGEPHIRFYAGTPLVTPSGQAIGTLCTIDRQPRQLEPHQIEALAALGRQVVSQLELRLNLRRRELAEQRQAEKTLQLQQAQSQLIQAEKTASIGQFVAGIAHEINNPITFIYSNLEHLQTYARTLLGAVAGYQKHCGLSPELQSYLEEQDLSFVQTDILQLIQSVSRGAERIRDIVLNLQSFSPRHQAGPKHMDVHAGLDSALRLLAHRLRPTSTRSEIAVRCEYGTLPTLYCYSREINQVFVHLLNNAIDAIDRRPPETPTLTVTTCCPDSQSIEITVTDNGCGMPPDIQNNIFDPFFTTKPVGQGTGLGLFVCSQIAVQHGGSLTARSQPQHGSTLTLTLPTAPDLSVSLDKPG